jgi:hypothetical protein
MSINLTGLDVNTIDRGIFNSTKSNGLKILFTRNITINNVYIEQPGNEFLGVINIGNQNTIIDENLIISISGGSGGLINYNL